MQLPHPGENSFLLCVRTISIKIYRWKTRWSKGPEEFWPQNLRFFLGEDLSCTVRAGEVFHFYRRIMYDSFVGLPGILGSRFLSRLSTWKLGKKSILGGALRDFYSLSAILKSFSLVVEKYFVMGRGQRIFNKNGIHDMLMVDVLSARV